MGDRVRPYLFYDVAVSICSTCYRKVEGKIVFQDGSVYMLKRCPVHGHERVLMADDVDYYRRCREVFIKPPEMPRALQHAGALGLPVRLRPLRRSSAALVPVAHRDHRSLQPAVPDLLRGERSGPPAVPDARSRPAADRRGRAERRRAGRRADFRRRADAPSGLLRDPRPREGGADPAPDGEHQRHPHRADEEFAKRLAGYMPDFEVYLQFDSFERRAAAGAARRRPARRPYAARSSGSTASASRPRWWSR